MLEKSRDLPLLKYLDILQAEYIVAELRSKIYYKQKDKKFWKERVMAGKKRKIEDIVSRNVGIQTIFDSDQKKAIIRSMVFKDFGIPNFYYKDEEQRNELYIKDMASYFVKGSEFRFRAGEDLIKTGTIISTTEDKEYITIKPRGEKDTITCHVDNVSRIL